MKIEKKKRLLEKYNIDTSLPLENIFMRRTLLKRRLILDGKCKEFTILDYGFRIGYFGDREDMVDGAIHLRGKNVIVRNFIFKG